MGLYPSSHSVLVGGGGLSSPTCSTSMWKGRVHWRTMSICMSVYLPENPSRGFCLCLSSQTPPPL